MIDYIETIQKISDAVLADYRAIYYIDLGTNEYVRLSDEEETAGPCRDLDFFKSRIKDAERFVYEEDREMIVRELSKEALIQSIRDNRGELAEYRLVQGGAPVWYSVRLIKGKYAENNKYAILGIRDINQEKQKLEELRAAEQEKEKLTQIASALANIFDSIYYVDLQDNSFVEFSSSAEYKKIRTLDSGKDFFELAKPLLGRYIHPGDTRKIECLHNKKEMLRILNSNKGAHSTEYRFIIKGETYYCRATIRLTKDGSHVLVSIANLGEEGNIEKKLQESERLSETYSQIAERLAEHYDNIYYVDVSTNKYMTFSSMKLLGALDRMERENNFFENVVKDVEKVVFAEDREMVLGFFERERLLTSLRKQNAQQLEYRLLINDEPNFVKLTAMLTKDGEKLLLCVENINSQVLRFESLARKATCDELTGAKNKNAYRDFEKELNEQIMSDGAVEFAIMLCDINNLKTINDTMGHNDGDAYIKSACRLICNTFVHSPVFRVGGDEFAVILRGDDYANRKRLLREFQSIAAYNSTCAVEPDRPVIASGICDYSEKHGKVEDVFNEADQRMYENKKKLKGIAGEHSV